MATEITRTDISNAPDLIRLADEVRREGRPRVLTRDDEELVMVSPIRTRRRRTKAGPTADPVAQREATLARTFGAWKNLVDGERLKREFAEAQSDDRPALDL
jgi:hypothetical protein